MHHCFIFNATATTEIYTLSLHDALPISQMLRRGTQVWVLSDPAECSQAVAKAQRERVGQHGRLHCQTSVRRAQEQPVDPGRSEEHTSELQSQSNLVCRLLLEKKKKNKNE